jgi:hypothetical protein
MVTEEDSYVNAVIKHINNKIAWVWTWGRGELAELHPPPEFPQLF